MSEMEERVARALRDSLPKSFIVEDLRSAARAAISAMRELPGEPGPRYTAGEYSRRSQEAMVDDALSVTNGVRALEGKHD
jgi:hypothetical protein